MDLGNSGIFRLASVGSYLDALSSITDEMSLRERSNLIFLDKCLHAYWGLGQNVILNWCPQGDGIDLLAIPHYAVAEYASPPPSPDAAGQEPGAPKQISAKEHFFQSLLSGRRRLSPRQMANVERLLGIERTHLTLRDRLTGTAAQNEIIEKMIKRYSITYVPARGVALFDIVGFSLLTPFEQMMQLNSLAYSLNSAQSKLLSKDIAVDFARTTTGDGFYIWNRDLTLQGNVNLYHFVQIVLADNAIAHRKAERNTVPRLRAAFHVGSSYEFHQAEGLNPTLYSYIVGDVTVDLARMIERALPGQILLGDFKAEMLDGGDDPVPVQIDSIGFVARAIKDTDRLNGLELSGERVESIKCYLTGTQQQDGQFSVRRIVIADKHGISRHVFNAKVNIYRHNAEPILLGIEDKTLSSPAYARHFASPGHA
ncbi:MAG TPA: hypothetical protein VIN61_15130 [Gammaproteobacteria bacterium]